MRYHIFLFLVLTVAACNTGKQDSPADLLVKIMFPYDGQIFVREDGGIGCTAGSYTEADPTTLRLRWSVDGVVFHEETGDGLKWRTAVFDPADLAEGAHDLKFEATVEGATESVQHTFILMFDEDGDGYATDRDCDDTDPKTSPRGTEVCDGIDNDCSGEVDEGC